MRLPLLTAALVAGAPLGLAFAQVAAVNSPVKDIPIKGQPTLEPVVFSLNGSDDCSMASTNDAISGNGTFAVNTTTATSGVPLASCGAIGNDVWFYWTSTLTGSASVSTCTTVASDSVIAVWADGMPAGSCPTTQITCLDDSCGLQTMVSFAAVAGTSYFINLGGFGGAQYSGTFSVNVVVPTGNDSCSLATAVVGNGPHAFDTTGATTGAEGQAEPLCLAFGSTAIFNDQWYTWMATATTTYEISLCAGTAFDSRVAVYNGSGCPTGAAIACNDDSCGLVSAACFSATAGSTYTIQIGAFGAGVTGPGSFQFTPVAPPSSPCAPVDDGTTENAIGWTAGGTFGWMAGYGVIGQSVTVSSVDTTYGTPLFPGGYIPSGPVTVAVYEDPNDDGLPNDAVFLGMGTAVVSPGSVDTDVFQTVALNAPVMANGIFFVAAAVMHNAGEFPSPLDQSGGGGTACGSGPGSFFFGNNTATPVDFMNINANLFPPASVASAGFPGNYLVRANCGPGNTGMPYCFGDGTGIACPCANNGAAGNGCANSVNAGGANLTASGVATVGADTVLLSGSGMPLNVSALYFQGTAQLGVAFGDGLRCVGGTIIRLGTKANSGGASAYPAVGDQSVSVRGMVPSGATRMYQIWYRNAAAFCMPSTFNLSNGLQITWQ
jgi:hypothetical protein